MQASIASDHESTTVRVRTILLSEGQDCPAENVHSLDLAVDRLVLQHPELIVVVLTGNPERALSLVSQLRLQTQVPVLVVGSTADSRIVLRALRSGATDCVDEVELPTELPAALSRLQSTLSQLAEPAQTIAVLAPSGGSGSSTVAVNVATLLAKQHRSTMLFDLKLQAGDLAALLDLKPTHTLADLCVNAARMDRIMFERSLVRHSSGVHLLAPPRNLQDIKYITPEGVRQALNLSRTLFPYVVVDLDHSFREEQLQVLRQANIILLILRLDFTCLGNTQRTLDYLGQLGIGADRLRVVVNRYGQAKEVSAAKAEEALGLKISHYIPEDAKTVNRANNNGMPVVLESPWAKVSRSIAKLADSVNGRTH